MIIHIEESGLYFDILAVEGEPLKFLNFSTDPLPEDFDTNDNSRRLLVEAHLSGGNLKAHHARKHNGSSLSHRLRFRSYSILDEADGRLLQVVQE